MLFFIFFFSLLLELVFLFSEDQHTVDNYFYLIMEYWSEKVVWSAGIQSHCFCITFFYSRGCGMSAWLSVKSCSLMLGYFKKVTAWAYILCSALKSSAGFAFPCTVAALVAFHIFQNCSALILETNY